jgi:two-component system, chemotaxis family, sensor kinase CheA
MENQLNNAFGSNPHLLNAFKEEANDLISHLESLLLALENDMSDMEAINHIFRVMHTLKGSGAMFGFDLISEFTHKMEDIYDKIRTKKLSLDADILNITLASVDLLRNLVNHPKLSTLPITYQQLSERITKVITENPEQETEPGPFDMLNAPDAKGENSNSYYIYFNPGLDVLDDGTNPVYLVQDLHEMGKCCVVAYTDNIPDKASFQVKKNYLLWHIIIDTKKSITDLEDNFLFLNDLSKPRMIQITTTIELTSLGVFIDAFQEKAKQSGAIMDIDEILHRINPVIKSSLTIKQEELGIGNEKKEKKESDPQTNKDSDLVQNLNEIKSELSSIRVASDKIDTMMNLISELITKQAELSLVCESSGNARLREIAEEIENISHHLRDNAFSISLVPVEQSLGRFRRMVRDVSNKLGKKVSFIIEGGETELDKTIIEGIIDPVMHILRNSIDHGIEAPSERLKIGKSEHGTILLKAFCSGTNVVMQIVDDGAGINLEKVRITAIKKGYIKETDNPTDNELIQMIMHPGFTTSENVSEVSGRGVGMDVVNQKIRDVRGELKIETYQGTGTTTTIILPLTISIIDVLLVTVGSSYFMISLSLVESCGEVSCGQLAHTRNNYLVIEGNYIPFINLSDEFSIPFNCSDFVKVIIVKYLDSHVGLIVDQIMGKYQAVLKPLGEIYRQQEIVSGACILGNGEVALVLDTNKLIRKIAASRKITLKNMATTSML